MNIDIEIGDGVSLMVSNYQNPSWGNDKLCSVKFHISEWKTEDGEPDKSIIKVKESEALEFAQKLSSLLAEYSQ